MCPDGFEETEDACVPPAEGGECATARGPRHSCVAWGPLSEGTDSPGLPIVTREGGVGLQLLQQEPWGGARDKWPCAGRGPGWGPRTGCPGVV